MFKSKFMSKTKLSLALSAVLAGGFLSAPVQAVQLAEDGLGDAVIYPYFTAKSGWQTFFRLINTSDKAVVVKVRLREAANSRELRDFMVALSPHDTWYAWTDPTAYDGKPGIRTIDTSCIFDLANTGNHTFQTINGHLKGVAFSDAAFTGQYYDGYGGADTAANADKRLREGYIEIIGVNSYERNTDFARAVTHKAVNDGDVPNDCQEGLNIFRTASDDNGNDDEPEVSGYEGDDVGNVLAANAYLINIGNGEGAGYDPVVLANFQDEGMRNESLYKLRPGVVAGHGSWPTLDSADALSTILTANGTFISSVWGVDGGNGNPESDIDFGDDTVAAQQLLADGSLATTTLWSGALDGSALVNGVTYRIIDPVGTQLAIGITGANIPASIATLLQAGTHKLATATGCGAPSSNTGSGTSNTCRVLVEGSPTGAYAVSVSNTQVLATPGAPARLTNIAHDGNQGTAVRGGVDAVSAVMMRRSVINEWGAFSTDNPAAVIKDYLTQWVLTFPTKHYYVDIQADPDTLDLYAPTLTDRTGTAAYAPFANRFNNDGMSCENYHMDLWNTEESYAGFNSPTDFDYSKLCYEVNVLSFGDQAFADKALGSDFSALAPTDALPPNRMVTPYTAATTGWARMDFVGNGSRTGLSAFSDFAQTEPENDAADGIDNTDSQEIVNYRGLPVVGFMLTNYGTGNSSTNHNAINSHKYEREINNVELGNVADGNVFDEVNDRPHDFEEDLDGLEEEVTRIFNSQN